MSKIEWTDATWNPVTGCTKVSPGCKNCYAERMARRFAGRNGYPGAPNHFRVTLHPERLEQPLKWKKPRMVFVNSMSDLFHEGIEILDSTFVKDVFTIMALCPQHTFQVLTKRPHVAALTLTGEFASSVEWGVAGFCVDEGQRPPEFQWPLPNVQLGVSVEKQDYLWRVDDLLAIPAAVRFVSIEPMLEPIDISIHLTDQCGYYCDPPPPEFYIENEIDPYPWDGHYDHRWEHLDWVIVGAESGPNRRPFKKKWAETIYRQCKAAGVPFFGKQDSGARPDVPLVLPGIGEVKEWPA